MKQSCRTFLFITSFVLGAKAEKGFKFVERSLENYWRKELKKRRLAVLGQPASLSAHPAPRPGLPSALPRADAPASLHPAAIRRRRGRAARPTPVGTRRLIPVGTPPRAPRRAILSPLHSLSFSARERSSSSNRRGAIVGRAPPLAAGCVSGPFSAPRPPPCSPSPR